MSHRSPRTASAAPRGSPLARLGGALPGGCAGGRRNNNDGAFAHVRAPLSAAVVSKKKNLGGDTRSEFGKAKSGFQ